MANMTFKANLLPDNTGTQKELGSSTAKWNIYGDLHGNATTATTATKLGTANKGSSTKPIYLSAGTPTECSTYAGGTKVTLNGSNKGAMTASFYAPIAGGTSGYILKSNGSDAPTWLQTLPVANGGTGVTSAADAPWVQKSGDTMTGSLTVGSLTDTVEQSINVSSGAGRIALFSHASSDGYRGIYAPLPTSPETGISLISVDKNNTVGYAPGYVSYWRITSANDVSGTSAPGTSAPLVIGPESGNHLEIDANEILAKSDGTTRSNFWLNDNLCVDQKGTIKRTGISSSWLNGGYNALVSLTTVDGYSTLASIKTINGTWSIGHYTVWPDRLIWIYVADGHDSNNNYDAGAFLTSTGEYHANKVWGAVYNDYAEMRNVPEAQIENNPLKPGTCVCEVGDGTMIATTERLQRGCKIISDTFGFNIGETDNCKTPIAVSGRALVYLDQDREIARDYIGWPVCSGSNGTVSIMTEEEEEKYPSRIVGTISEIPDYEKWGSSDVEVNGRIWIYVR